MTGDLENESFLDESTEDLLEQSHKTVARH